MRQEARQTGGSLSTTSENRGSRESLPFDIHDVLILPPARKLSVSDTFRHTYRTWLDATGAPVGVQQKLLRDADIGTTMKYGNALMDRSAMRTVRMARPLLQQAHA